MVYVELRKGQKIKLSDLTAGTQVSVSVSVRMKSGEADITCFGVDGADRLSDDRYFIFYNQTSSPEGAMTMRGGAGETVFSLDLGRLPAAIEKLVVTVAADGGAGMRDIQSGRISLSSGGASADYVFDGGGFQEEKALILCQLYRKDGIWRYAVVASGFNGGLSALLAHFGGEEQSSSPKEQTPPPAPKINLTKQERVSRVVLEKAPHLLDLTKKAMVSLEKKQLSDVKAQVVLVLDESGSMYQQYKKGRVQRLLDKVLPLALLFDDDGVLDVWAFATRFRQLEPARLDNIADYVKTADGGWQAWDIGGANNEPAVMQALVETYQKSSLPVYILFISDGGVSQNAKIKRIITHAATGPLFWQFVGIGGRGYGALEKLDELSGRYVDNANFFALDDIDQLEDSALYDRLMGEFPQWLRLAKEKQIL